MKRLLILITGLSLSIVTMAQDLHYSQFYSAPMILNPALTGRFSEDYRVAAIHRRQWKSIQSAFETSALGVDMNFKGGKLNHDKIGLGFQFYKDQMGNNTFRNTGFLLSAAYHKTLDAHKRHHLSIGAQGGYTQRSINSSNFQFGNQYQNWTYNPDVSSNESLDNLNQSNFDLQAGLQYGYRINEKMMLDGGLAVFQLLSPKYSVLKNPGNKNEIGTRLSINLGLDYKINHLLTLYPRALYMNQSNSSDLNLGAYAGYLIDHNHYFTVFLGGFYRAKDAGILLVGLGYKKLEAKFSYDFNASSLRTVKGAENAGNGKVGAWEISLIFKGVIPRGVPKEYTVPCGIF